MVTTDDIEIRMFITNGLYYLPVRCTTDEDMKTLTKVLIIPSGKKIHRILPVMANGRIPMKKLALFQKSPLLVPLKPMTP